LAGIFIPLILCHGFIGGPIQERRAVRAAIIVVGGIAVFVAYEIIVRLRKTSDE
jgi:hypothetical protein